MPTRVASVSPSGCSRSCRTSSDAASRRSTRARAPSAAPPASGPSTRLAERPRRRPRRCCRHSPADPRADAVARRAPQRDQAHRDAPAAASPRIARARGAGRRPRRDGIGDAPRCAARIPADVHPRPSPARIGIRGAARSPLCGGARRGAGPGSARAPLPRHGDDGARGGPGHLRLPRRRGPPRRPPVPRGAVPHAPPRRGAGPHPPAGTPPRASHGGTPPQLGGEGLAGLGRVWERVDLEQALACYRAALAAGLAGSAAHGVRLRLARWEKRAARWEAARALWEVARQRAGFDREPWEELAKLHEHRARDLAAARGVTGEALALARGAAVPERVIAALEHRLARLERRLARRV